VVTIPIFSGVLLLGLGVGIMLTNSLNSHAAASTASLILIPADLLHMLSTGVWVGGLICFMLAVPIALKQLRPGSGDRTRLLATLIPNFSDLAILAVLWLFTTGILQAIVQIGSLDALFNTNYGKALCLKLIIIVPLLGLGGYHNFVTGRKLRKFISGKDAGSLAAGSAQRWFRRTIIIEVALALVLLVVVGVLTSLGPSREAAIAAPKGPFILHGQLADIRYTIGVSPGQVGENILEMELLDSNGKPITQAQAVLARVSMEGMGDPQELQLKPLDNKPGIYRTIATVFSMAGNWSTTITIRRDGIDDVVVPLSVPIGF
jgi:copper transport protein